MEFTEDEISDCVSRWSSTGLLYGLPLHEKQELAPIFDNISRIPCSQFVVDFIVELVLILMLKK